MTMDEVMEKLRGEARDEVGVLFIKPNPGNKYHVMYLHGGDMPTRCRCGRYTITNVDIGSPSDMKGHLGRREISIWQTLPEGAELNKECLGRHVREMDKRAEAKLEETRKDLRKMGDDIMEIVRDEIFMMIHTIDIDGMRRIVDDLEVMIDAQKLRTLKRFRPKELEDLLTWAGLRWKLIVKH